MYSPVKDGIEKNVDSVLYVEARPSNQLSEFVHCFWELKTQVPLKDEFCYNVLPDACVNLLFDQVDTRIAAVTALQVQPKKLNLGKKFHYVGVQLLPGVWRGAPEEIINDLVDKPYCGSLSLVETNAKLVDLDFAAKQTVLSDFVNELVHNKLVEANAMTAKILSRLDDIQNVAAMAEVVGLSPRQLQRNLKQTVGLSPHDFLKILRIQQSFKQDYLTYYADQSHYIHSFRKITGYTPTKYNKKYGV